MSTWSRDVIDANFLQLLVVVIRSLSYDAALIIVYAFVTRRIDYCYSAIAGVPFCIRERLHRLLPRNNFPDSTNLFNLVFLYSRCWIAFPFE